MPYCDNFWHIGLDAHENIPSPACLIVFVKSKTENQLIRLLSRLSSRQQRKMWNSCWNARPQTSSFQRYGLLTVLTLILFITGYEEYCSNVFIDSLLTRSQAVARIADRTAKNCRGHVTEATPTFREIVCAPARHSRYKAENQIWSL